MNKSKIFKRLAFAFTFAVAMLLGVTSTANAQGHQKHERRDLKSHQRMERDYYGNNGQIRSHQRLERDQLKYEQRLERNGYGVRHGQYNNRGYNNNGYYNNGYYNGGYYGNNSGYYGSDPYYNNSQRHSNNRYYSNRGYYGNNIYNGNNGYYGNRGNYYHRDSRNPIRRIIHHALGGH